MISIQNDDREHVADTSNDTDREEQVEADDNTNNDKWMQVI